MMRKNGKKERKKIKINKKQAAVIGIAAVALVITGAIGTNFVVAKYYAYRAEKGISIASAFYFNSDKLTTDAGSTREEDIKAMDVSDYSLIVNSERWTSGTYTFLFQVRNYDNNLLYNETGLDLKYKLCFYLIGSGSGASYKVGVMNSDSTAQDGTSVTLTAANPWAMYEGSLNGGSLQAMTYRIQVELTSKQDYDPDTKVLVVAYPTAPDYQVNETNQVHRLVGVFQPHLSDVTMKIYKAQFLVQEDTDYTAKWLQKVQDLSGLIYNVKTAGDALVDSTNAVKKIVVVKWKTDYLTISSYDKQYLAACENDKKTTVGDNPEEDDEEWLWNVTGADGMNWTYMKLEMPPYSSVNITFYKTEKFLQECVQGGAMNKTAFEGLVGANIAGK